MPERPTGRPGAPRDSAPAAVYVVFGPALKKLWKSKSCGKFKLVMALAHKSLRLESFAKFGRIYRNNETKFGWVSGD